MNAESVVETPSTGGQALTGLATVVGRVAYWIEKVLPPGDVAELRRMDPPERPLCPAFFKLSAEALVPSGALPADGPTRDMAETRWAVILAGMAETAGLHNPSVRLGSALAPILSEPRFLRLLRSHDHALHRAVRVTAHHLASRGVVANWCSMALLVLSDGRCDEETVRRSIARDYYASNASKGKE